YQYVDRHAYALDLNVQVIEGAFELFMAGKKDEYDREVARGIREVVSSGKGRAVSVGQLSIAAAALNVSRELDVPIGNMLEPLHDHLVHLLGLPYKIGYSDR
ncbi:MAG: hypothetical protein ACRDJH_00960, partial [Thermomicrobiales bacterium]